MKDESFHEERRKGLGGTDSPVILGVSKYKTKTQLAMQKLNQLPPEPPNSAMLRGTYLEPIVADIVEEQTGLALWREENQLVHPDHEWMVGHIDRWCTKADEEDYGVLEIKCPGMAVFSRIKREGLPAEHIIQLQHYLAVTGKKWGVFAIFNSELWQLIHFEVKADQELQDIIIEKDLEFWSAIQAGQMEFEEQTEPEVYLPPVDSKVLRLDTETWKNAVRELYEAKQILKEAQELEEMAKQDIISIMGPFTIAESEGFRAYIQEQKGRITLDAKAIKERYPDIYALYSRPGKPFTKFSPYFLKGYRP